MNNWKTFGIFAVLDVKNFSVLFFFFLLVSLLIRSSIKNDKLALKKRKKEEEDSLLLDNQSEIESFVDIPCHEKNKNDDDSDMGPYL